MLVGLAALGLLLHGLLHLVGYFVPWQLSGITQLGAEEAAGGRIRLGPATSRILGLLWLLIAAMFVAAAAGLLFGAGWTLGLIIVASGSSLPLCLTKLPEMAVGAVLDVIILIIVVPIFVTGSPLLG
jgi:hypothetical protein